MHEQLDSHFTLMSDYPSVTFPPHMKNFTTSQYLLEKAAMWSRAGKINWMVNAETGFATTFSEFEPQTRSIGSSLCKRGMRGGDILIYMTNDPTVYLVQVGVWRANGIVHAVYPEEDEETLLEFVKNSHASFSLCGLAQAELCLAVGAMVSWNLEVILVSGSMEGCTQLSTLFSDDGQGLPTLSSKPSDIALILCTSGSTGPCKGSAITHEAHMNRIELMSRTALIDNGRHNLLLRKPTVAAGVRGAFGILVSGNTCLALSNFNNKECFVSAMETYKPASVFCNPSVLASLLSDVDPYRCDFSSIEICVNASAPLTLVRESTLMRLPNMKVVHNSYATTEGGELISTVDYGYYYNNNKFKKLAGCPALTVGKPVPGCKVQIRDVDCGIPLGPNIPGELYIKADGLFSCYYKNPLATKSTFIDGWFKTGDLGMYDENGFIFIIDRIKDVFKSYGFHISPTELERVILEHPAVSEVCVVGIGDTNANGGGVNMARAFVVLKVGFKCDPEEIEQFAHNKLATYKHLHGGLYIVNSLPKGKTGKISRQLAAQMNVN